LKDIHVKWCFFKLFYSIGVTGGFEGVTTSFAITKSSHASTNMEGVAKTIWYLHLKGVDAFI
jgi:hypothetical protein